MVRGRDIEVTTTETALGWPVACVDAGDTTVYVRQDPAGPGLLIEICTKHAPPSTTPWPSPSTASPSTPSARPAAWPDRRVATGHLVQMRRSTPMSDLIDTSSEPPASEPPATPDGSPSTLRQPPLTPTAHRR